jgi:hypothetical protein
MPLSREVWETYFLVLSKTYAAFLSEGLTVIAGPIAGRLLLRRIAENMGVWGGSAGVEHGLLAEIRRLTNVVMPGTAGWETVPLEVAISRGTIDGDALAEIEGAIVFFICVSAVLRGPASREKLTLMLDGMKSLWGAQTTSSDVTEYAASLPTSTRAAVSAATPRPASSVPG